MARHRLVALLLVTLMVSAPAHAMDVQIAHVQSTVDAGGDGLLDGGVLGRIVQAVLDALGTRR